MTKRLNELKEQRKELYDKQSSLVFQLNQIDGMLEPILEEIKQLEELARLEEKAKEDRIANDYSHGDYLFHNEQDNAESERV